MHKRREWVRYEGPRGGEGWINVHTGDVAYQDERPRGSASLDEDSVEETFPSLSRGYEWDMPIGEWKLGDEIPVEEVVGDQVIYLDLEHEAHRYSTIEDVHITESDDGLREVYYDLEDGSTIDALSVDFQARTGSEPDYTVREIGGDGMEMATDTITYEIWNAVDFNRTENVTGQSAGWGVDDSDFGEPQLTERAEDQLEQALMSYFDPDVVNQFQSSIVLWKDDSQDGRSDKHSAAFAKALDIQSESRAEIHGEYDEVSDEHVRVAKVMSELSRQYWDDVYDGEEKLYRGISGTAFRDLMDDWMEDPTRDSYKLNHLAVNNYTPVKGTAKQWGHSTATIGVDISSDQVALATDQIANFNDWNSIENEVHVIGDDIHADPSDIHFKASHFYLDEEPTEWAALDFKKFGDYVFERFLENKETPNPDQARTIFTAVNAWEDEYPDRIDEFREGLDHLESWVTEAHGFTRDDVGSSFADLHDEKAEGVIDLTYPEDRQFLGNDAEPPKDALGENVNREAIVDSLGATRTEKEWVQYQGPHGGEGWQNTNTGEVRYQDAKPIGGGNSSTSETMSVMEVVDVLDDAGTSRQVGDSDYRDYFQASARLVQEGRADPATVTKAILGKNQTMNADRYTADGITVASDIGASITGPTKFGVNLSYITDDVGYPRTQTIAEFAEDIAWDYHVVEIVEDGLNEWQKGMFSEECAPMFQLAADITGNDTLPEGGAWGDEEYMDTVLEMPAGYEEKEAFEAKMEQTHEVLREAFGDTMTVYRGMSPSSTNPTRANPSDVSVEMREAKEAGESFSHEHRPVEAWTTNPSYAARYAKGARNEVEGGAMLKKEIPIERVFAASHTDFLAKRESEVIVMHDEEEVYHPEQVTPSDEIDNEWMVHEILSVAERTRTEKSRSTAKPERHIEAGTDPQWLHRDPPEAPETDNTPIGKEWVPYMGPDGGEGWQRTTDGEVRYQQDPPGEVDDEYDADYWTDDTLIAETVEEIEAFDEDDYEYGEWRGIRWDNIEVGTFVSVGVDEWGIETEQAKVVAGDGETYTAITESGDTVPIGDRESTYVAEYFDPMEWRAGRGSDDDEAEEDDDDGSQDHEPDPQPEYEPPETTHPLAPGDRNYYKNRLDQILDDHRIDFEDRDTPKRKWAGNAVAEHYRREHDMTVNLLRAKDMDQLRNIVADIEELRDADQLEGIEKIHLSNENLLGSGFGQDGGINAFYSPYSFDIYGNIISESPQIQLNADIYHREIKKSYGTYPSDPRHTLWHELSHHHHIMNLRENHGYDLEDIHQDEETLLELAEPISEMIDREEFTEHLKSYLRYDALEFPAEVVARHLSGEDLPDEFYEAAEAVGAVIPE